MAEKQHWNGQATETLLLMWGRDVMDKKLKQLKWDQIFEKVSEVLVTMGYNFSGRQCHTKLKNMVQTYRREKKSAMSEGREPDCLFYRELEHIFHPLEVLSPPLFQRIHVEIDPVEPVSEEQVISMLPISASSSERSSEEPIPVITSSTSTSTARQLPVLFSLACSSGNSNDANGTLPFVFPGVAIAGNTDEPQEQLLPVIPTTVTIDGTAEQPGNEVMEEAVDSSSSSEDDQLEGSGGRRKPKNSYMETLMVLLQEEAEDREDARQQRLLEHESRMEERRQHWEEQRRERELQMVQKWEEQRREKEFKQLQHITQMFLQGLQHLAQKDPLEESQEN